MAYTYKNIDTLCGAQVDHPAYGRGEVVSACYGANLDGTRPAVYCKVEFDSGKVATIDVLNFDKLKFEDSKYESAIASAKELAKAEAAEIKSAYAAKVKADIDNAIASREKAKAEESVKKSIARLESDLAKSYKKPDSEDLEWLAKNMTSIDIKLPDRMDKWFVSKFGNVKRTVVDTSRKTCGGNEKAWTLGMKLRVKASAIKDMPASLRSMYRDSYIRNTAFIYDLIVMHGFQPGVSKQDLSKIF